MILLTDLLIIVKGYLCGPFSFGASFASGRGTQKSRDRRAFREPVKPIQFF
jgi:hypothetical protein